MSANFTPSLNSYTDLTPFRFWCQKILPLVYEDSLSYYELLCKVIDYLNKTMEDVNLSIEDVEKLHTAYDSLQKYVNDYFDNLDVQEEINNKLDALVEDGTIHDIFNPDVEAILNVANQAASDAIEAIPQNVTNWLNEHVNPESDVVIDDTLSIHGAAADAKKTGDEISALKSDLNEIVTAIYQTASSSSDIFTLYPTNGYINPNTGALVENNTYKCYYYTSAYSGDLWFTGYADNDWVQIATYNGTIFTPEDMQHIGSNNRGTLPNESNKMPVNAGDIVVVCVYDSGTQADDFTLHYPVEGLNPDFAKMVADIPENTFVLTKINSAKFNIVSKAQNNSAIRYDFERYSKTWDSLTYLDGQGNTQTATNVVSCNYWNNLYVYNAITEEYIAQGNSNFITQVEDEPYHTGDGHGNEVLTYFAIIADGKEVDYGAMANNSSVICNTLRIIEKSNIYALGGGTADSVSATYPKLDTSGNPIVNFLHTMEIVFHADGNDINNTLTIMQDNITFDQCHGAMLECNFGSFDTLSVNDWAGTMNNVDSSGNVAPATGSTINLKTNPNVIGNRVAMYGGNFYISQEMIPCDTDRYSKANIYFVYYYNRVKAYLQPLIANLGLPSGETAETFNAGDSIRVVCKRKIELT